METIKLSRRDFTKAVVGAGAFYFGLPHLARVPGIAEAAPDYTNVGKDPLIVLVKKDELKGFRGFEEFVVRDEELAAELHSRYVSEAASHNLKANYGDDHLVVLVRNDESFGFKGLNEVVVRDSSLIGRLSSRFKAGG